MDTLAIIQQSIDYIEENLKTDIRVEELSQIAGFSVYHYYRLFREITGTSVMRYILRRRLLSGIYDIAQGGKIIDVALCYGFDTHAGFFKAFRREYGCSPSAYLKRHKALKPHKIDLKQEDYIMLTHSNIATLLTRWGLSGEAIADVYYGDTGQKSENTFYIGENLVLKASVIPEPLQNHIHLSKALESASLAAASPVATTDDQEYIQENGLYYMVTRRLSGKPMRSSELYHGDYAQKARCLGEIIGQLHNALKDCGDLSDEVDLYQTVCGWALPKTMQVMDISACFLENYHNIFGALYKELPKQAIHRDPNPSNIILIDGKPSGFVDFELSEINVRIFDPCYAATAILSERFGEQDHQKLMIWVELYKNILHGYDCAAHLSDAEKQGLPYVVFSIQIICVAYFSGNDKYSDLAQTNIKMLNWLIEHKEYLKI